MVRGQDARKPIRVGESSLSGPWIHENLTIYLVHDKDRMTARRILTLEQALAENKAIVHETGNVNELQVENTSADAEVFIQSGDIVKGGKQDRLLAFDLILGPKSGKVQVISYCVDHARWQQRGKEAADQFGSATTQLPSKPLKLLGGAYGQLGGQALQMAGMRGGQATQPQAIGALGAGGVQLGALGAAGALGAVGGVGIGQQGQIGNQVGFQGGVWTEVNTVQQRLRKNSGATESGSSLQLTLEDDLVRKAVGKYAKELSKVVDGRNDVVGFVYAVNGKVGGAEIYATNDLFRKLWPKLLNSAATEALADLRKGDSVPKISAEQVQACLADAEKGKKVEKNVSPRTRMSLQETDKNILLETRDRQQEETWIHRSYLTK
jgi:hypothetical protein